MLRGKAEDRDTGESGRNVLREPFPYEDADEDGPEEDTTLALEEDALAAVHRVEELDLGHEERVHGPRRVDEVVASEARETVANQLRRNQPVFRAQRSTRVNIGAKRKVGWCRMQSVSCDWTGGHMRTYVKMAIAGLIVTL